MNAADARFDWDDGNREKCRKHGLPLAEIEYVLAHSETLIVPDVRNSEYEPRFIAIGRNREGRYTFVAFTPRRRMAARSGGPSARAICTRSRSMKKKFPILKSDEEAEAFLEQDLTDYLHAGNFKPMRFEFKPKQKSLNLRISEELLEAVRKNAKRQGIPYQRFIRQALERAVMERKR